VEEHGAVVAATLWAVVEHGVVAVAAEPVAGERRVEVVVVGWAAAEHAGAVEAEAAAEHAVAVVGLASAAGSAVVAAGLVAAAVALENKGLEGSRGSPVLEG
jgi:hypothetical protein